MSKTNMNDVLTYLADEIIDPETRERIATEREQDPHVGAVFRRVKEAISHAVADDHEAMSIVRRVRARLASAANALVAPIWQIDLPLMAPVGFDDLSDPDMLPNGIIWGLSMDQRHVIVRCPYERVPKDSFPYGVALLIYRDERNRVIDSALMPVLRNEELQKFQGRLELERFLPEVPRNCDPGRLELWEVPEKANPHDVQAAVWDQFSSEAVARLLADPFVKYDRDLSARVSRLWEQKPKIAERDETQPEG